MSVVCGGGHYVLHQQDLIRRTRSIASSQNTKRTHSNAYGGEHILTPMEENTTRTHSNAYTGEHILTPMEENITRTHSNAYGGENILTPTEENTF